MNLHLNGSRVIVTAGAAGIGKAIASGFRDEGANVIICDVDDEALTAVTSEHGIVGHHCDVADRTAVDGFIHRAAEQLGGLDILINNAGVSGPTAAIDDIDPDDWQRTLDVCLTGQFNCIRAAAGYLRQSQNASIINLSSAAGKLGFAERSPYAAAKWGVIGLTKSLAIEMGEDNIRVNAILPGIVAGERQQRVLTAKAESKGCDIDTIEAEAFSYASLKEYVTAEQLADHILFLTSVRGKTVTGQAISVCGDLKMLA